MRDAYTRPMPATPAWPPRSAPRLFVPDELSQSIPITIDGNQAHYLSRVMRASIGDTVILCDDITGEWAARITDSAKRTVTVEPLELLRQREAVPDLWLCPALLKKDRFDMVLEKATELGVARIVPVVTSRCVADKLNADRARTLTVEAAEQCARTALPQLAEPLKLAAMLRDWPGDRTLFFADETGGEPAAQAFAETTGPVAIITGPEGGFTDQERDAIAALHQSRDISLGPRILRGETAALASVALWMGIAGDWTARPNE